MAGFITTDDGSWEFRLDDAPEVPELPVHDPFEKQGPDRTSYLAGPGKWENYSDLVIYEMEALLRKWFEKKLGEGEWTKRGNAGTYSRRYTCKMVFESLYGRPFDAGNKDDQTKIRRLPRLLAYYSSRIQKGGSIRGKSMTKTIYTFSVKRCREQRPYSLRLRLEWLASRGELPCWQNMRLPNDDLKAGEARNPKTNENMRRRREKARERYAERYRDRKH